MEVFHQARFGGKVRLICMYVCLCECMCMLSACVYVFCVHTCMHVCVRTCMDVFFCCRKFLRVKIRVPFINR